MRGYIDLHCHWLVGVDDGARSLDEARLMLSGLYGLGFDEVVATPHIRPQMFDNSAPQLRAVFDAQCVSHCSSLPSSNSVPALPSGQSDQALSRAVQPAVIPPSLGGQARLEPAPQLPTLSLAAEHYFVDAVHRAIVSGQALPYRGDRAVLLELHGEELPTRFEATLAALRRGGLVPVIAHPERYRALWQHSEPLEAWLDAGAAALLDIGALVGKYGANARDAASRFLQLGYYSAACSDAHRSTDVEITKEAMSWLTRKHGIEETHSLFHTGPRSILEGTVTG